MTPEELVEKRAREVLDVLQPEDAEVVEAYIADRANHVIEKRVRRTTVFDRARDLGEFGSLIFFWGTVVAIAGVTLGTCGVVIKRDDDETLFEQKANAYRCEGWCAHEDKLSAYKDANRAVDVATCTCQSVDAATKPWQPKTVGGP